ncbi:MAG: glutamate--ammonia ligase [Proteobacteria bacterium]|uniref:Glutamine synthetase n=1 Tax=Candidatus Avisuccinivibrio stercorigallinarum TaxID=2840704 RepID=A0A9D9GTZ1_9GAMM|nr:glutamate--ammonia ligase [Candidatus Avisuccinivibrio stercorigallinarum]
MTVAEVMELIAKENVRFADLRFTDTKGKEQHVSIPAKMVNEDFFTEGKMFDGSSMAGWKGIDKSDMVLMPDVETVHLDPFYDVPTIIVRCDVLDAATMSGYDRDPRSVAKRAEDYLRSTGLGDECIVGPEPEFFIFDDVRWDVGMGGSAYQVDAYEAAWNSKTEYEDGNLGHRTSVKGGYFPVPPVDPSQDIRSEMCMVMEDMGLVIEAHHHEVATCGQNEIACRCNTLTKKADEVMIYKYVVQNVADKWGKSVTFMPKPIMGDNGSGMHCHFSFVKDGQNTFAGNMYGGLSQDALWFIGGIIKHAKALNAFTNPSTNSYKRLVPGFEAPVMLAYSAANRSASIRIPHTMNPKNAHLEVRFPDCMANPYLAFAAMLMAGIDGILNRINPGDPMDKNLYDLPPEEAKAIPQVCSSLEEALNALVEDHEFLTEGGVFTEDMIKAYIEIKRAEVSRLNCAPHPVEFEMYYSL